MLQVHGPANGTGKLGERILVDQRDHVPFFVDGNGTDLFTMLEILTNRPSDLFLTLVHVLEEVLVSLQKGNLIGIVLGQVQFTEDVSVIESNLKEWISLEILDLQFQCGLLGFQFCDQVFASLSHCRLSLFVGLEPKNYSSLVHVNKDTE